MVVGLNERTIRDDPHYYFALSFSSRWMEQGTRLILKRLMLISALDARISFVEAVFMTVSPPKVKFVSVVASLEAV